MSKKELCDLNDFCAETVLGWRRSGMGWLVYSETHKRWLLEFAFDMWKPTTDFADAMRVLERCAIKRTESWDVYRPDVTLAIHAPHPEWNNLWVIQSDAEGTITAQAETFPLAVAKFAVALFKDSEERN